MSGVCLYVSKPLATRNASPPSYDELFAWLGTLPLLEHIELENALPANTLVPKTQYRLLNLRDIIIWARPSAVMGPFEALLLPSPNRVQIIWGNIYTRVDDARIEAQHFSRLSSSSWPVHERGICVDGNRTVHVYNHFQESYWLEG